VGASKPDAMIRLSPSNKLLDFYLQGRFPSDRLVRFYDFDQTNQDAEDTESGMVVKPIIRIGR
jgi:aryl-alcohol dehydrogenase